MGTPKLDQPPEPEAESPARPTLVIAVCSLGQTRLEWALHLAAQIHPIGAMYTYTAVQGQNVPDARNIAVANALEMKAKYLMFWDDDMIPLQQSAVPRMFAIMQKHPEIDLLTAIYPMKDEMRVPLVVKERDQGVWWNWRNGGPTKVHRVFMAGTGFMFIRLARFAKLKVPKYTAGNGQVVRQYFKVDEMQGMSDDFCLADLCEKQGIRWYADGGTICNQINLDGTVFRIEDGPGFKIEVEKEVSQ